MPWIVTIAAAACLLAFLAFHWYRLSRAPSRPAVITSEVGITLFFMMFLLGEIVQVAAASLFGITEVVNEPETLVKLQIGRYAGQALVLIAFIVLWRRAGRPDPDLRVAPRWVVPFGIGALGLIWPLVQVAGTAAGWVMQTVWGQEPKVISHDLLVVFVQSKPDLWFWLLTGCATVLPGIFEEVMYRVLEVRGGLG